ncbi:MAG: YwiC-like family protein [Nitrospirota bacterium]
MKYFLLTISRQYGGWSILISSFILGASVGRSFGQETLLLLFSAIAGFLTHHTLTLYTRLPQNDNRKKVLFLWTVGYLSLFLIVGLLLVIWYKLYFLVLIGLLSIMAAAATLILMRYKKERTYIGEFLNIFGLSLIVPATEYTATGIFSLQTIGLWVISIFFFEGSVFHVRYLVRNRIGTTGSSFVRLKAGLPSIYYHIAVLIITIALCTIFNILPSLAPLSLIPVTIKSIMAVVRRHNRPLSIQRIGHHELIHTLIFIFLAVLAFRMPVLIKIT